MVRYQRKRDSRSETADRKAVVVLGMHRSGTSALCGALDLMGVDFGKRLMPATDANEKGYWEHEEVVRAHDRLLSSLGSSWDDDEPLPADWLERETTCGTKSHLLEILDRDFGHSSLFGIKDPRMCRLMPLWFRIFQTLRAEPHFVLTVRHPWEVAESLRQRDGIEHPKGYFLWLEHLVEAECATSSQKRSFVTYQELMDCPVATLGELREQFGAGLRAPSEIQTILRQFLEPSLRHHESTKQKADEPTPPVAQLALDFYETVQNAATLHEITRKLKPLAAQFIRNRRLYAPASIRTTKLSPENVTKVLLEVSAPPREVRVSTPFWLDAEVENGTNETLFSAAPYPVNLAYHWMEKTARHIVVFDGVRSRLSPGLDPNSSARYPMKILSPDQPGEYILQTTIVQEGVCWFEDIRPDIMQEFALTVIAPQSTKR